MKRKPEKQENDMKAKTELENTDKNKEQSRTLKNNNDVSEYVDINPITQQMSCPSAIRAARWR